MTNKTRLDIKLFDSGYTESREKAKALIMSGSVYVNGKKTDKSGVLVTDDDKIEVRAEDEFVSRGGYKLKKALSVFKIDLSNKTAMDVGASTGGFTDCMLKNGAAKVYSVDVGYGQLSWKLRNDERVINLERTNARYLNSKIIPCKVDFVSIDASFISLTLILPAVYPLIKESGICVALIKPQFEAGREKVGKNGVVRDESVHCEVIGKIYDFSEELGFSVTGLDYSPIKGPKGNIEYLICLKKDENINDAFNKQELIRDVVNESHRELNKDKNIDK